MELIKKDGTITDLKLAVKNIKIELKNKFNNVKFSVKGEYTGGSSKITISYVGHPERKEIQEIANKYKSGNFNSIDDSYDFNATEFNKIYGKVDFIFISKM